MHSESAAQGAGRLAGLIALMGIAGFRFSGV
jgi:hypothetical protein